MPRRGENIYKRKDGRWEARYICGYGNNGKAKYRSVYAHTYIEAKRKREEQKVNDSGKFTAQQKDMTVQNAALLWLGLKQLSTKESTYAKYYHAVTKHIIPEIGNCKVTKLTLPLLESYVRTLNQNGKLHGEGGLSSKTVSDLLTILKSILDYASQSGTMAACNWNKISVKQSFRNIQVLTPTEQKQLTMFILKDLDNVGLGILLSLYAGLRLGEVCALKWENVNLSTGVLSVRQSLQRIQNTDNLSDRRTRVIIQEPKSRASIRDIPLPEFLKDILYKFAKDPEAYLLTGTREHYMEPRCLQNRFKRYLASGGIAKVNYHALRHSFATTCVELGFEIKSLSEILGHSTVNITLNRYVHSSMEMKRDNMNKLTLNTEL